MISEVSTNDSTPWVGGLSIEYDLHASMRSELNISLKNAGSESVTISSITVSFDWSESKRTCNIFSGKMMMTPGESMTFCGTMDMPDIKWDVAYNYKMVIIATKASDVLPTSCECRGIAYVHRPVISSDHSCAEITS